MNFPGIWIILVFVFIGISVSIAENSSNQTDIMLLGSSSDTTNDPGEYLVRIDVQDTITQIPLPIYAHLLSTDGTEYVLVKASPASLQESGLPYTLLDPDTRNATYAIVSRNIDNNKRISDVAPILYDDGKHLIVKTGKEATRTLLLAGYHITWLDTVPRVFREAGVTTLQEPRIGYDSRIADMVNQISQDDLNSTVAYLSGERPVTVGGLNYTIITRDASYPELLNISTDFAYEYLSDRVPNVSYFPFNVSGFGGRNIIGEKIGTEKPEEIILVTAHIDSISINEIAPGADDDGSGTAAVMACADIFRRYAFERTIRFVIFSREEDGLYGSLSYVRDVAAKNESVIAVYNMDLISWNGDSIPNAGIHTRLPGDAAGYADDMVIAEQFNRSVYLYNISRNLTPQIVSDGEEYGDHYSFWSFGYPAVNAIEDFDDFNPYYHSDQDRLKYINLEYFTNFTKASLATAATIAGPVGSPLTITSLTPVAGTNFGPNPVINITGTGFTENTTVTLTRSGSNPLVGEVLRMVTPDTLSCLIPITGAEPGAWNVRIQNPDGKIDLKENGFTITDHPACTISASCSVGGIISPSGNIEVPYGGNITFSLIPTSGYKIESVQVNQKSIGPKTAYTFTNVTTNQTIFGTFALIPPLPGSFLIVASHDNGGIIYPDGVITVPQNGSQMFKMFARAGYEINSVLVDGIDTYKNNSYTFASVTENHTISLMTRPKQGVDKLPSIIPIPTGDGGTYKIPRLISKKNIPLSF